MPPIKYVIVVNLVNENVECISASGKAEGVTHDNGAWEP